MRKDMLLSRRVIAAALPLAALALPTRGFGEGPDATLLALKSELEGVHAQRLAFTCRTLIATGIQYTSATGSFEQPSTRSRQRGSPRWLQRPWLPRWPFHYDPAYEVQGDGSFRDLSCSLIEDLLDMTKEGCATSRRPRAPDTRRLLPTC